MKPINKIVRTYQTRIVENEQITKLLGLTYQKYNQGSDYFLSLWKTIAGGFTPEKPELCLSFWFTLETEDGQKNIIPSNQIFNKFNFYWNNLDRKTKDLLTPQINCFFDTIESSEGKGKVWVDQRQSFLGKNNLLKIKSDYLQNLYDQMDFEAEDDGGSLNNQFTRSLISSWWGNGKITDWDSTIETYKKLYHLFKNEREQSSKQLLNKTLKYFNKNNVEELKKELFPTKKGRNDASVTFLLRLEEKPEYQVTQKMFDDYVKTLFAKSKTEHFEKEDWMESIREEFERTLKLKFQGEKRNLISEVSTMFAMALQRHSSYHSNFLRHLLERIERKDNKDKAAENFSPHALVDSAIESCRVKDQKYFSTAQFRGKQRFLRHYEEHYNGKNGHSFSVKGIEKDLGDLKIFSSIATALNNAVIDPSDLENSLDQFVDLQSSFQKYYLFKSHCLTSFNKAPNHPWFGSSKGTFELKDRNVLLGLFDGNNFVDYEFEIRSNRFENEIYSKKEGIHGSRERKIVRKFIGDDKTPLIMGIADKNGNYSIKPAAQIFPKHNKWYLNISVNLSVPRMTIKETVNQFVENNGSVLGIDLGQRTAVAFAHLKKSNNGKVSIYNEKGRESIALNVIEYGELKEEQLFRKRAHRLNEEDKNKVKNICRLSYSNREAGENEKMDWSNVRELCIKSGIELRESKVPETAMKLYEDIVFYSKLYVRSTDNLPQANLLVMDLFPKILKSRIGGLSFQWINLLMQFKSVVSCLARLMENGGIKETNLLSVISDLTRKMNAVRKERARISASLIIKKAIEIKEKEGIVPVIAIERLNMKTSQSNNAKRNARTTNWCSRRIIDFVKEAATEFGILVKEVDPRNSSMEDCGTGEWKPRFEITNTENLKSGSWHYNFLMRSLKKPNGQREAIRREVLMNKLQHNNLNVDMKNLVSLLKKESNNGKVYVPTEFGSLYYSSIWGWMNSDVHAAINLGCRGVKLFLGWVREKKDGKADKVISRQFDSEKHGILAKMSWRVEK